MLSHSMQRVVFFLGWARPLHMCWIFVWYQNYFITSLIGPWCGVSRDNMYCVIALIEYPFKDMIMYHRSFVKCTVSFGTTRHVCCPASCGSWAETKQEIIYSNKCRYQSSKKRNIFLTMFIWDLSDCLKFRVFFSLHVRDQIKNIIW